MKFIFYFQDVPVTVEEEEGSETSQEGVPTVAPHATTKAAHQTTIKHTKRPHHTMEFVTHFTKRPTLRTKVINTLTPAPTKSTTFKTTKTPSVTNKPGNGSNGTDSNNGTEPTLGPPGEQPDDGDIDSGPPGSRQEILNEELTEVIEPNREVNIVEEAKSLSAASAAEENLLEKDNDDIHDSNKETKVSKKSHKPSVNDGQSYRIDVEPNVVFPKPLFEKKRRINASVIHDDDMDDSKQAETEAAIIAKKLHAKSIVLESLRADSLSESNDVKSSAENLITSEEDKSIKTNASLNHQQKQSSATTKSDNSNFTQSHISKDNTKSLAYPNPSFKLEPNSVTQSGKSNSVALKETIKKPSISISSMPPVANEKSGDVFSLRDDIRSDVLETHDSKSSLKRHHVKHSENKLAGRTSDSKEEIVELLKQYGKLKDEVSELTVAKQKTDVNSLQHDSNVSRKRSHLQT